MGRRDPHPPVWSACADDGTGAGHGTPSADAEDAGASPPGATREPPCDDGRLPGAGACAPAEGEADSEGACPAASSFVADLLNWQHSHEPLRPLSVDRPARP